MGMQRPLVTFRAVPMSPDCTAGTRVKNNLSFGRVPLCSCVFCGFCCICLRRVSSLASSMFDGFVGEGAQVLKRCYCGHRSTVGGVPYRVSFLGLASFPP